MNQFIPADMTGWHVDFIDYKVDEEGKVTIAKVWPHAVVGWWVEKGFPDVAFFEAELGMVERWNPESSVISEDDYRSTYVLTTPVDDRDSKIEETRRYVEIQERHQSEG